MTLNEQIVVSDSIGMERGKKLEFYGGPWISFVPFIVFLTLILTFTFFWKSISDGALWVPAFMAILITFFFAKDKKKYAFAIVDGIASREAIMPVICWFFAGVFSRILRESGLADGVAGFASSLGVGGTLFTIITFVASAIFATASGTGFGTIAAGMGVLYPAGVSLGVHPGLLAGVIISGAAFGDNLAPVSDTTICSATSQGVDVPGVVRSRFKYAISSAAIVIIAIVIFGIIHPTTAGHLGGEMKYDPNTLIMFIPVAITVYIAIKTGDIVIAASVGIVLSGITGVCFGLFDLVQIDPPKDAIPALVSVHGEGLDRTVDGVIYRGIASMLQVSILAMLLFGSISIMRQGGGDLKLLQALNKVARSEFSAELTISLMVIVLSALMGLNAPAILAVGASFAKPMGIKHGISPYRVANLMDATSNTLVYCLPWTPAMIYTLSFASDTKLPLIAAQVTPFVFYSFAMLFVMFITMIFGIGRNDFLDTKDKGK